jgi:hypothetical protein
MGRAIFLASLAVVFVPAPANACRVLHPLPQQGELIAWDAACVGELAEGRGVLSVTRPGKPGIVYEVTMARGEIAGDGVMRVADGTVYAGTFLQGQPHGQGYFRYPDGSEYEGGIANGQPEGRGVWTGREGTRYSGQWKAGKKDGKGRIDYALGGSYDGDWADDAYNGQGILTYAGSGRTVSAEFRSGLPAGTFMPAPAPPSTERYVLKEDRRALAPVSCARSSPRQCLCKSAMPT